MVSHDSPAPVRQAETHGGQPEAAVPSQSNVVEPAVAIVTITLNDPIGIRRTITSVEQQPFTDYEHVVVDGGSPAGIVAWLRSWERADPMRRRLITDPPPGIYPAMNAGLRSVRAPLILILNGGDQLLPGVLGWVVDDHRTNGWQWAYGGVEVRDKDDRRLRERLSPYSRQVFRAGIEPIPHAASYVTRELYDLLGPYREDLGTAADQEFFLRASVVVEPTMLPRILSAFEYGGVSQKEGIITRELVWHRLRTASHTEFGGSAASDAVVTAGLLLRSLSRWALNRGRRLVAGRRTASSRR